MISPEIFIQVFGIVALDFFIKTIPPVLMFCLAFERRPHFRLRLIFLPVYIFLYSLLTTYIELSVEQYVLDGIVGAFNLYLQYLLLLLGVFLIQAFLFQNSASALLFNLLGGYALHEICLFLFDIVFYFTPVLPDLSIRSFQYYGFHTMWFFFTYLFFYHTLIKPQIASSANNITNNQPTLYLSVGISLFLIAFNLVRTSVVERRSVLDLMCILCLILFYTLILLFRSGLLKAIETEKEIALTKKVWEEKEKSLVLTMDAIKTINIKYHDLKHIASKLKNDADAQEYVTEITDSLRSYEHTISTGNDTLDMILTEQTLKFNRADIDFSCIADGGAISFMSSIDIISLFSNALDNAYEAVIALPAGKREICLTIKQTIGMVSVVIENPYFADITIRHGLPLTTKHDKAYHGFGVKSIQSIVKKYGGDLDIATEQNYFKLKILIPVHD